VVGKFAALLETIQKDSTLGPGSGLKDNTVLANSLDEVKSIPQ